MSEREVQGVANFLQSQGHRFVGYLDIHSYSQILMFPWGYTKRRITDYEELVHYKLKLCEQIGLKLYAMLKNIRKVGKR